MSESIRTIPEAASVEGPSSSTNHAVPRFDGTDGQTLENSVVTVTDGGNVTGVGNLTTAGAVSVGTDINMNSTRTVDGRDVSADGAKLDTVETSADVTDATNVDAAGAVMETDYGSRTVLVSNSANTPITLSMNAGQVVGIDYDASTFAALDLCRPTQYLTYDNPTATSGTPIYGRFGSVIHGTSLDRGHFCIPENWVAHIVAWHFNGDINTYSTGDLVLDIGYFESGTSFSTITTQSVGVSGTGNHQANGDYIWESHTHTGASGGSGLLVRLTNSDAITLDDAQWGITVIFEPSGL